MIVITYFKTRKDQHQIVIKLVFRIYRYFNDYDSILINLKNTWASYSFKIFTDHFFILAVNDSVHK